MKRILKHALGQRGHRWAHRISRLRWLTKYRLMRSLDADASLRRRLLYVLWDPEIESFSFDLANEDEVVTALAEALNVPAEELARYAAETHTDPEFGEHLRRHLRWRFDVKRRPPLGNRFSWYLMVRALKPPLVIETGIHHGLGSLVLLRALEHNAREGSPGELISFDIDPRAGNVVREEARRHWNRLTGSTRDLLEPALEGRRVSLFIQDTPHTEENQRFEFGAALSHAAPDLLMIDCSTGFSPTLEQLSAERGGRYHRIPLRARDHVYGGGAVTFATFGSHRGSSLRTL